MSAADNAAAEAHEATANLKDNHMTDKQIEQERNRAIRAEAEQFARDNLQACCAEVLEWQETAILKHGQVRTLAAIYQGSTLVTEGDELRVAEATVQREAMRLASRATPVSPAQPELTVWYGPMPESNGRSNFTAILMHKGGKVWDGITIDRSEYPDRVRYEADRVRYLLGELAERPFILDYDADKHSGYVEPARPQSDLHSAIMNLPIPAPEIKVDLGMGAARTGRFYTAEQFRDFRHAAAELVTAAQSERVEAICDAYESGMGHGLQRDGHKSGAMFASPECGKAYELGYEAGEERASAGAPAAGEPVGYFYRDAVGLLHQFAPDMVNAYPEEKTDLPLYTAPVPAPATDRNPDAWMLFDREGKAFGYSAVGVKGLDWEPVYRGAAPATVPLDEVPFLILFDDQDRKPEMVIGDEVARKRFAQISVSWNAHLFVKVESNSRDCRYAAKNAVVATATVDRDVVLPRYKLMSGEQREWMAIAPDGHWCKYDDAIRALKGKAAPAAMTAYGFVVEWPNDTADLFRGEPKPDAAAHWDRSGARVRKLFVGAAPGAVPQGDFALCGKCNGSGLNGAEFPTAPHCPACNGEGWAAEQGVEAQKGQQP